MEISKEKLLEMYRTLVRARHLSEKLVDVMTDENSYMQGLHRAIGEEAIPVAVCAVLRKDDYYKPSGVRMHPYLFCKEGFTIVDGIASECGRDLEKVGGHNTYISPELGLIGKSGIVGEDGPMYLGSALSAMIRKTGQVTVFTIGDGGSNRGPIHESMAMAACLNLPMVFMIQNNQWAMGHPAAVSLRAKDVSDRAKGYGFPGVTVDGNDVIAMYEAVKEYVDRARSGGGPGLIVANTFRLEGHMIGDGYDKLYRPKGQHEEYRKKDPLPRYQKKLLDMGVITDEDVKRINAEAKAEVDEAAKAAIALPFITYESCLETAIDVL